MEPNQRSEETRINPNPKYHLKPRIAPQKVLPNLDHASVELTYKIAHELLESAKSKEANNEFESKSAENMISECGRPVNIKSEEENAKIQFKILNGGSNIQNYKKMLEYLAETVGFKANYQSLLGVRTQIVSIMINYHRAVGSHLSPYLTLIIL